MIFRVAFAVLFAAVLGAVSYAASPVSVIGPVTPGDCTSFFSQTQIQDALAPCGSGSGGGGTVTSVALSLPNSLFIVTGSPIVSAGTLTGTLTSQNANTFFAGPTNGAAGVPAFRPITRADLPLATASAVGVVQPDGTIITVSGAGAITVPKATTSVYGVVKPDGTTITAANGVLSTISGGGSGTVTQINTGGGATGGPIVTSGTVLVPGGYLNRFRNGTFDIWQRGTSSLSTSTPVAGSYTADGWQVQQTGAAFTCAQITAPTLVSTSYALQCVGGTSNTDTIFSQPIESFVATPLDQKVVTVQFYYRQTTGGSVTPKISSCFASAQDNFTTCTGDLLSTSLTACANNIWCLEAYTFTVSNNANQGYRISIDCNTALTAIQNCAITQADIRVTPGVATGINANPPPPELRPIAAELAFCQRYFYDNFPGLSAGVISEVGQSFSTTSGAFVMKFPVTMRAIPTLTISSVNDFEVLSASGSNINTTGITLGVSTSTDRATLSITVASGLVAGNATFMVTNKTAAFVALSSEL